MDVKKTCIGMLFLLFTNCGPESNLLGLASSGDKDTFDTQLALAVSRFDHDDFDQALIHAERAVELNPTSETAAVVLGYTYLAKAKIAPFDLVEALGGDDKNKQSNSSEVSGSEGASEENDQAASPSDALGGIDAFSLDDEEFNLLASRIDEDDPDLPVIVPLCAGEARQAVERLALVNRAITVICPFVNSAVRLSFEDRHQCVPSEGQRTRSAMSHLLWAFSHLMEALAFHSVVTYSTTDSGETNLEQRVASIQSFDVSDLSQLPVFIKKLEDVTSLVDEVIPVSGLCKEAYPQTQIVGLINDLLSVSTAFAQISGVPPSLTQSITSSVDELEKIKQSTSSDSSEKRQSQSIKADFTKQMSKIVGTKISEADADSLTSEQTIAVCDSYSALSSGEGAGVDTPELCKNLAGTE